MQWLKHIIFEILWKTNKLFSLFHIQSKMSFSTSMWGINLCKYVRKVQIDLKSNLMISIISTSKIPLLNSWQTKQNTIFSNLTRTKSIKKISLHHLIFVWPRSICFLLFHVFLSRFCFKFVFKMTGLYKM